jgi:hypothetical protein
MGHWLACRTQENAMLIMLQVGGIVDAASIGA